MRCNWCGSNGDCSIGCECQKCIDPNGYDNWKYNSNKTFSEQYKNWLKKERQRYSSNINLELDSSKFFWK